MPEDIKSLAESYRALEAMEEAIQARVATIKTPEERREVDRLIASSFHPRCDWEKKNFERLLTLALTPKETHWAFRLRERIHRMFHPPSEGCRKEKRGVLSELT
jgi:hypothetical protein